MTALVASMVPDKITCCVEESLGRFVEMDALQAEASRTIAQATGAEAGCVSACVAAGICISLAAAMTGVNLAGRKTFRTPPRSARPRWSSSRGGHRQLRLKHHPGIPSPHHKQTPQTTNKHRWKSHVHGGGTVPASTHALGKNLHRALGGQSWYSVEKAGIQRSERRSLVSRLRGNDNRAAVIIQHRVAVKFKVSTRPYRIIPIIYDELHFGSRL